MSRFDHSKGDGLECNSSSMFVNFMQNIFLHRHLPRELYMSRVSNSRIQHTRVRWRTLFLREPEKKHRTRALTMLLEIKVCLPQGFQVISVSGTAGKPQRDIF